MAKQRPQVRDLESPERIQPAPVQSSTYAPAAPPPLDNNLEALARGLGVFASGMNALGARQKADDEKRLREEQLGAYEAWKASVSSDEHLEAIRSGKLPITVDRILDSVVKKDGAVGEARKLAEEIDKESGNAGFGSQGFDPERYVLEKAKPYVERLSRDPKTMAYFGDQLDQIRAGVTRRHEDVRGQLQTTYLENRGKQEIGAAMRSGAENGLTPQQTMDALRAPNGIYAAVGPRLKKGSLDLSYGRMDELTLDELEDMAKDPKYAPFARDMLDVTRPAVDGKDAIGPLSAVHRHNAKIDAIRTKALKTLGGHAEVSFKDSVRGINTLAIESQSTAFNQISDIEILNPEDPSKTIKYSAAEQKEQATRAWLAVTRQRNGIDETAEVEHLQGLGIKHPELGGAFNSAFAGVMGNLANKSGPSQVEQIVKWGDKYMAIAELNPQYADLLVNKDAKELFDTYRVLRYMGWDPQQAATDTAVAFGQGGVAKDPNVLTRNALKIEDTIRSMDFNGWWPGGGAINQGNVKDQLIPMAKALARTHGVSAEEAVERAGRLIVERAPMVNGRVVLAPFLKKDDAPQVQPLLDAIHKKHSGVLKAKGIPDGKHLSLAPWGAHKYVVVKWDEGSVMVPAGYDHDGQPLPGRVPLVIEHGDIAKVREIRAEQTRWEGQKALEDSRRPLAPMEETPSGNTPVQRQTEALRTGKPITIDKAAAPRETPAEARARHEKRADEDRKAIEQRD